MQYRKTHVALLLIVGFFGCNPDSSEVVVSSDDCATNPTLYDYCLKDINPSSITYGKNIGPDYFEGQITLHYFGHQY